MAVIHSPPNEAEMKQLWVFVSVDPGGEGICAAGIGGTVFSMVTASEKTLAKMKETAAQLAKASGKSIKLVRFTAREDVMEFKP